MSASAEEVSRRPGTTRSWPTSSTTTGRRARYDEKWSISFDQRCIDYARDRFEHVAGRAGWPYPTSLELGCGTGFFTLNLKLAGVLDEGHVSDLSPGMVEVAQRNAKSLGFEVEGRVADAERLPYDDDSFDLVIGHAVLHHIPDVELAFREVLRVLKPGGRFVFAGEPTRYGDVIARRLSRFTWWATTHATRLPALAAWRRPQEELDESSRAAALEVGRRHPHVPARRARGHRPPGRCGRRAGDHRRADRVVVRLAGAHVRVRGAQGQARACAGRTSPCGPWQRLSAVDRVLERVVPKGLFYNAEITGLKP